MRQKCGCGFDEDKLQMIKENRSGPIPVAVKVKEEAAEITEEATTTTLRRAISYYSSLQASDGHWPTESAGPLYFLPPLVCSYHC